MNRADIVEHVAGRGAMAKPAAGAGVGSVFAPIAGALARGGDLAVAGLGRSARAARPVREGRHPCAGRIAIRLSSGVSSKAGEARRDAPD